MEVEIDDRTAGIARKVRLVGLLAAAEDAGLVPLPVVTLHALAYFSNVLAPVWDAGVLDGRVLKNAGGPYYPTLQADLDRLVGAGMALITDVGHRLDEEGRWRLSGAYRLNREFGDRVIASLSEYPEEHRLLAFIKELAYAFSALSDEDLGHTTSQDATYGNPAIDRDNVVDFAEWTNTNFTANAAMAFTDLVPGAAHAEVGELIHLYVQHMQGRMHGRR